jgi:hypothetical protein
LGPFFFVELLPPFIGCYGPCGNINRRRVEALLFLQKAYWAEYGLLDVQRLDL